MIRVWTGTPNSSMPTWIGSNMDSVGPPRTMALAGTDMTTSPPWAGGGESRAGGKSGPGSPVAGRGGGARPQVRGRSEPVGHVVAGRIGNHRQRGGCLLVGPRRCGLVRGDLSCGDVGQVQGSRYLAGIAVLGRGAGQDVAQQRRADLAGQGVAALDVDPHQGGVGCRGGFDDDGVGPAGHRDQVGAGLDVVQAVARPSPVLPPVWVVPTGCAAGCRFGW